jgi:hypothetical protein
VTWLRLLGQEPPYDIPQFQELLYGTHSPRLTVRFFLLRSGSLMAAFVLSAFASAGQMLRTPEQRDLSSAEYLELHLDRIERLNLALKATVPGGLDGRSRVAHRRRNESCPRDADPRQGGAARV